MSYTLNIGLAPNLANAAPEACDLPVRIVVQALQMHGFQLTSRVNVRTSDTEATVVVDVRFRGYTSAALKASLEAVAKSLGQDCIAVFDNIGFATGLYGPNAAAWGEFNPEFFLLADGTRLSDHAALRA